VRSFLAKAAARGVQCALCEVGTFDIMMSRIWRHWPQRPASLIAKVRAWDGTRPTITLPAPGKRYPMMRTNAFEVTQLPGACGRLTGVPGLDFKGFKDRIWNTMARLVPSFDGDALFWGSDVAAIGLFPAASNARVDAHTFSDPLNELAASTTFRGFVEHGLAQALAETAGLGLRLRDRIHHIVVPETRAAAPELRPLRHAIGTTSGEGYVFGKLAKPAGAVWAEALSVRLEHRNGRAWLLLRPELWIKPLSERENATDFLRQRRLFRYNPKASYILDAWIEVLLAGQSRNAEASVTAFAGHSRQAAFKFNPRSAISRLAGP
jgi:hypothetical protein